MPISASFGTLGSSMGRKTGKRFSQGGGAAGFVSSPFRAGVVCAIACGLLTGFMPDRLSAADDVKPTTFALENGLQVLVVPDDRVPIVVHSLWYKVGGVDDGEGLSGRAHFLEHMMFKATRTRAKGELDRSVAFAGGLHNAITTYDSTYYYQVVPKAKLAEMMAFEADRMTSIQFTDDELERERGAIMQERKSRVDSQPASRLGEKLRGAIYGGSVYRMMPIGSEDGINAVSTASALELYRRTYGPNNALLVVAGDVTEAEVRTLATATYGVVAPLAQKPRRPEATSFAPLPQTVFEVRDPQVTLPGVVRFFRAPALAHPDYYPLLVLQNHLNVTAGRLRTALVNEQRVASSVSADLEALRLGGLLSVGATAAVGVEVDKLAAALDGVLDDVRRNGVPDDQVTTMASAIATATTLQRDDIVDRANYYAGLVSDGWTIEAAEALSERSKSVTPADVRRVAEQYLAPENAVRGLLLPAAAAAAGVADHPSPSP
ncbi:MAG: M16 family metallopeptidase [Hyphomicrobium sp.]